MDMVDTLVHAYNLINEFKKTMKDKPFDYLILLKKQDLINLCSINDWSWYPGIYNKKDMGKELDFWETFEDIVYRERGERLYFSWITHRSDLEKSYKELVKRLSKIYLDSILEKYDVKLDKYSTNRYRQLHGLNFPEYAKCRKTWLTEKLDEFEDYIASKSHTADMGEVRSQLSKLPKTEKGFKKAYRLHKNLCSNGKNPHISNYIVSVLNRWPKQVRILDVALSSASNFWNCVVIYKAKSDKAVRCARNVENNTSVEMIATEAYYRSYFDAGEFDGFKNLDSYFCLGYSWIGYSSNSQVTQGKKVLSKVNNLKWVGFWDSGDVTFNTGEGNKRFGQGSFGHFINRVYLEKRLNAFKDVYFKLDKDEARIAFDRFVEGLRSPEIKFVKEELLIEV